MSKLLASLSLLLASLAFPAVIQSHTLQLGNMDGTIIRSAIDLKIILPEERLLKDRDLFIQYTRDHLKFSTPGGDCPVNLTDFLTGNPTLITLSVECSQDITSLTVLSTFFTGEGYSFSARFAKDGTEHSVIFDDATQTADFDFTPTSRPVSVSGFLRLGLQHIFTGADHILFVLTLVISATAIRPLVKTITAFTIAHSLTLFLSHYNLISVSPGMVEPAIALSISLVALGDLISRRWQKKSPASWPVAFFFGLIHGLGFAGALQKINLPGGQLIPSLLSFNIGIEIGQLLIVAVALPIMYLIIRQPKSRVILDLGTLTIGTLGLLWFFQRIL